MICGNCKQTYDDNMANCPHCGAPKQTYAAGQGYQPQQQRVENQTAYAPVAPPVDNGAKGKATGALVCGIVGIALGFFVPIVGIILGILGMTFGNTAKKSLPEGQNGMATGGFICGIIAIVISVIMWVVSAVLLTAAMSYIF